MRAQQGGNLRAIGADIDCGFPVLGDGFAARVRPDHGGNAARRRFGPHRRDFLVHLQRRIAARVDGESNGRTAQPQGIVHRSGDRLVLACRLGHQRVGAVHFQDRRNLPGKGIRPGLQHAQGGRIGVQAGVDGKLKMVVRIIAGRVGRIGARRAMFKALIHRQNDHLAGAAQTPLHKHPAQVGFDAGRFALVMGQDLLNCLGRAHDKRSFRVKSIFSRL